MSANRKAASLLILLPGVPLAWALAAAVSAGLDVSAWQGVVADPQWLKAMATTLWTGVSASLLATGITAWILCSLFPGPAWARLVRLMGPMLAVPHVAFAIGLLALVAPSGWLLRAVSPWATGFTAPPPWVTTQDPWGLALIAVLTLKEVPFLLWAAATQLQRGDVAFRLTNELNAARSMGYSRGMAWRRVVWPQLWPRLRWPLLAVLAYGLTVVDVALVIGPGSPPTLAVLAWTWLQDADLAQNAQGIAAAWSLALMLAGLASAFWAAANWPIWRTRQTSGQRGSPAGSKRRLAATRLPLPVGIMLAIYLVVMLALLVGSVSGVWAFPSLLPQTLTVDAWLSVAGSFSHISATLTLALASALTSLVWSVAWLEFAPPRWDKLLRRALYLPLVLPAVVWLAGFHAFVLRWDFDASWMAVWLAHCLATLPYVLIALSPAYLGFDVRYGAISASLGKSRWQYLTQVKWPLLRAALFAAAAVGFAVSVAQYLPTLFIGAGRIATVTTEAVTLASGAQRSLTSAYAALQWLLPVIGFGLAAWVGQPRRFEPTPRRQLS